MKSWNPFSNQGKYKTKLTDRFNVRSTLQTFWCQFKVLQFWNGINVLFFLSPLLFLVFYKSMWLRSKFVSFKFLCTGGLLVVFCSVSFHTKKSSNTPPSFSHTHSLMGWMDECGAVCLMWCLWFVTKKRNNTTTAGEKLMNQQQQQQH